jgi:hypothetical protein
MKIFSQCATEVRKRTVIEAARFPRPESAFVDSVASSAAGVRTLTGFIVKKKVLMAGPPGIK